MSEEKTTNLRNGILINVFSVLCNSIAPIFSKFAMKLVGPYEAAFWVTLGTSILALAYRYISPYPLNRAVVARLLPIAFVNAIGIICLYASLKHLDPVTFGFMGRLYVVFTTLLSVLILKEKFGFAEGVLIGLALVGSLVVGLGQTLSSESVLGLTLAVAYTFLFALSNMMVKQKTSSVHPALILLVNNGIGLLTVTAFFLGSDEHLKAGTEAAIFLSGAVVFTFIALSTLFVGFKMLSFRLSNLIRATSPLVMAGISWPFFPLALNKVNLSGGVLLVISLMGLGLVERKK